MCMRSWVVLEVEGLVITFFLLPRNSSFWLSLTEAVLVQLQQIRM